MYMFYSVSSPYLLVFDDDRIRSTREHMMLQVDRVRHSARAGLDWERVLSESLMFYDFEINF